MKNQETLNTFNDPQQMKMAGFGPRWGALLVDGNILLLVTILFLQSLIPMLTSWDFDISKLSDSFIMGGFLVYLLGIPLLRILYQSIFECSKFQGTPGKMAVKIKVVNMHGERITFLQALGRNLGKILSGLILYIGFFMAIWTDKKQTLHDQMANTYVVLKR